MNAVGGPDVVSRRTLAVQRGLVKAIGEHAGIPLEFKHVEEILRFAAEDGVTGQGIVSAAGLEVRSRASTNWFCDSRFARTPLPQGL